MDRSASNGYISTVPARPWHGVLSMNIHLSLQPLLALLAGILILIRPKLLNYVVAIYLIVIGILGLFPALRL
jgi:hypothetical protein